MRWLSRMELIKTITNYPIKHWCYQQLRVYYKNGYIRIERIFEHPMYGRSSRVVNYYKGTRDEAMAYSRMLRWD